MSLWNRIKSFYRVFLLVRDKRSRMHEANRLIQHLYTPYYRMLDYANGQWAEIESPKIENVETDFPAAKEFMDTMIQNLFTEGRDRVLIIILQHGYRSGVLIGVSNRGHYYNQCFSPFNYPVEEAMPDFSNWCRQTADKLGFVAPKKEGENVSE